MTKMYFDSFTSESRTAMYSPIQNSSPRFYQWFSRLNSASLNTRYWWTCCVIKIILGWGMKKVFLAWFSKSEAVQWLWQSNPKNWNLTFFSRHLMLICILDLYPSLVQRSTGNVPAHKENIIYHSPNVTEEIDLRPASKLKAWTGYESRFYCQTLVHWAFKSSKIKTWLI